MLPALPLEIQGLEHHLVHFPDGGLMDADQWRVVQYCFAFFTMLKN
jgi:hypothetical protein